METPFSIIQDPERLDLVRRAAAVDRCPLLDRLTSVGARALRTPAASVSFVDGHRQIFQSAVGLPEPWRSERAIPLAYSFCRHAVESGRRLVVEDAERHPLVRENPSVRELNVRAYAGYPLVKDGYVLGTFNVVDDTPRAWSASELALIEELADAAMIEIGDHLAQGGGEDGHDDRERLEAARRAFEDRTRVLCHDLRSPLSAIYATANLLLDLPLDDEERSEHLRSVGRVALQMDRLVNNLLDLATLNSGGLSISIEGCDLQAILSEVEEVMKPQAGDLGVQLTIQVPDAAAAVLADPLRVNQVLANLIGNALKFTPSGGRVDVEAVVEAGKVRVSVRDDGPGIAPGDLDEIWTRHWQGRSDDRRGVGLGLSIVRAIVEAHGERIGVRSEPGEGSEFWFTLAIDDGTTSQVAATSQKATSQAAATTWVEPVHSTTPLAEQVAPAFTVRTDDPG